MSLREHSSPLRVANFRYFFIGEVVNTVAWVNTPALVVAFFVAGAASSVLGLAWNLTVQEKVPEEMLSRIMAIDGFFSFVAMPIGQLLVGPLSSQFGIRGVELGSFALTIVVMVVGLSVPAINNLRLVGPAAKQAKSV